MLLMASVLVRMENGFEAVGVTTSTAIKGCLKGLVWSAGFGLFAAVGGLVLVLQGIDPLRLIQTAMPRDAFKILLVLVVGGFIGPVVEEFFFRGILYGYCRRWGVVPAVFLSTLVFVSLHPVKAFAFTQAVGGVLFAAAYEVERNLMVPIVIHVLGNLALFSVALVF
jgi:membrane protease YdiL (CAAX protease family)